MPCDERLAPILLSFFHHMLHYMNTDPSQPVQERFEQLQEEKDDYLQLRNQRGGWYV